MLTIASSYYKGDKETGVFYSLVSTEMCDGSGTKVFPFLGIMVKGLMVLQQLV